MHKVMQDATAPADPAEPVDANVEITVDLARMRDIEAMDQADQALAEQVFGAVAEDLEGLYGKHKDALDGFARQVEETDKERAQYLLDTIADGVKINGVSVRDMVGDENVPRFHNLKKANYNVRRMLQEAVADSTVATVQPDSVVIDFTIHKDIQQWADELGKEAM